MSTSLAQAHSHSRRHKHKHETDNQTFTQVEAQSEVVVEKVANVQAEPVKEQTQLAEAKHESKHHGLRGKLAQAESETKSKTKTETKSKTKTSSPVEEAEDLKPKTKFAQGFTVPNIHNAAMMMAAQMESKANNEAKALADAATTTETDD